MFASLHITGQRDWYRHMNSEFSPSAPALPPLCVDLDGTLVRGDTLWELVVNLLHNKPWQLLKSLALLWKGRASFKAYLTRNATLDPKSLLYDKPVMDLIVEARKRGRKVVLATGSNQAIANLIADHLGLFDEVLGSDDQINFTRHHKAKRLQSEYGLHGFDYIGNSRNDIPVWNLCNTAYIVGPLATPAALGSNSVVRLSESTTPLYVLLFRSLRPHQWLKNLLVFVPILTSHHLDRVPELLSALLTAIAFSLTSSAIYLLNDLLDLAHDRNNAEKRKRPLASGEMPLSIAFIAAPILAVAGLILAFSLKLTVGCLLIGYVLTTFGYSIYFKKTPMIDVVCLAMLYTMRIICGNEATAIPYSPWLLALSLFAFLSLALMKRCAELAAIVSESKAPGRYYQKEDLSILYSMGTASAFITVLIMALYINSSAVWNVYRYPGLLWALCPIMIIWFGRAWILTHRGLMTQDPIVFALSDTANIWIGAIILLVIRLAS